MENAWMPLFWFGLIVVIIPAALWLLKRSPIGAGTGTGLLRTVATLPLSTSQRVAIVEVGHGTARRWLVLGLSPQQMHTLHSMEPMAEALPPTGESGATFAQLLSRLRREP